MRSRARLSLTPGPPSGVVMLDDPGPHDCVLRWSRATGRPRGLDVEGLALRVDGPGRGDVLLASTGTGVLGRHLLMVRTPHRHGPLTTLLPLQSARGPLLLGLDPEGHEEEELPTAYRLLVSAPDRPRHARGRLDITWTDQDCPRRHDPVGHPPVGSWTRPFWAMLRDPSYVASQQVEARMVEHAPQCPSAEELRARIAGWGADLDPADRPSVPREQLLLTGAHWTMPEDQAPQPGQAERERSIEHGRLPPVYGASVPLRGLSGTIRRHAYRRYIEARAAQWLLLLAADRVDAQEHHLASLFTTRPDNPITQTGVQSELGQRPLRSRFGQHRADAGHHVIDPVLVVGPWVLAGGAAYGALRFLRRRAAAHR